MVASMKSRKSFSILAEVRDVVYFLLSILFLPIGLLCLLVFKVYSTIVEAIVRCYLWEKVDILTGSDVLMTHECTNSTANLTFYVIVEGNFDFEMFKEFFAERLVEARDPDGSLVYPRLRYCLHKQWGYHFWRKCTDFRLDNHVHLHVGRPVQSEDEILRFIEEMYSKKFPSNKPQWMMTAIPLSRKNQNDLNETCLLFRINHAIADGMSFIRVFEEAFTRKRKLSTYMATLPPNPKREPELQSSSVGSFLGSVYRLPSQLVQQMRGINRNVLYGPEVTGKVLIGNCDPLELSVMKRIKEKTQTTVNDVIMTCVAGALSRFFASKGSTVPDTAAIMMPVAFHDFCGPPELVNRLALVRVDLPTGEIHSLDRLMTVASQMQQLKSSLMPATVYGLMKSSALYPFAIRKFTDHLVPAMSIVSNVPGFKAPLPLVSGQTLTKVMVFLPMHNQTGTVLAFFSLGTKVFYSIIVDKSLIKDREEVQKLGRFVEEELRALDAI